MTKVAAISLSLRPEATSSAIWRSRRVGGPGPGTGPVAWNAFFADKRHVWRRDVRIEELQQKLSNANTPSERWQVSVQVARDRYFLTGYVMAAPSSETPMAAYLLTQYGVTPTSVDRSLPVLASSAIGCPPAVTP